MINPMDMRRTGNAPLTFEINYYITARPPLPDKGYGKQTVLQECTDVINLGVLGLDEESKNRVLDFMYVLKQMFAEIISEGLGLEFEAGDMDETENGSDSDSGED